MKTKLMLALLVSVPVATRAMESVDNDLEKMEQGIAVAKGPLADFMQACGVNNEDELARRVRGRIDKVERLGHDPIIQGLTYLATFKPSKLAQLQPVLAPKRAGADGVEEPVDQVESLTAAVDILEGINGALITGANLANNWNQTDTVGKIEAILTLATQTLAKLDDKAKKTGCWGFCKKQPKPAAVAAAPAAATQADAAAVAVAPAK